MGDPTTYGRESGDGLQKIDVHPIDIRILGVYVDGDKGLFLDLDKRIGPNPKAQDQRSARYLCGFHRRPSLVLGAGTGL
jgi:hypothetical protein